MRSTTTTTQRRRVRETPDYAAAVRRMIQAHGRRVAHADPEDLAELVELRAEVDRAAWVAVDGLRANGFTWQEIGDGLGITRQSAQVRWTRK